MTRSPLAAAVAAVVALAAAALAACRPGEPPLFERRSARHTGVRFANRLAEDDSAYNPIAFDYVYNGAGVAVGDFNNDGRPDLYFGGNMVSSRLYLNRGGLRFEDATAAAGVGTDVWVTGVAPADVNGDGLLDLYVCVGGREGGARRANRLFVNLGAGPNGVPRFAERGRAAGVADTGYTTHAAFFDYDRDGDLDLYVLTNALESYDRSLIRPRVTSGRAPSTDRLYRNNGDGTFADVSRAAGITVEGYGLGVAVADLNQDGWPDVYVANDFLSNDLVWVNNQDGTFTNQAARYLKHQTHNGMGVDVADADGDGRPDVAVVDMLPRGNARRKLMLPGSNYDRFHMALRLGYEPQYMRNTLQRHNGVGPSGAPSFSEVGQMAGVHDTDWSWAPLFADFDHDGRRDLFISNGYRRDVTNLDFIVYGQQAAMMGTPAARRARVFRALKALPEVRIASYAFRNEGGLAFTDQSRAWGLDAPSFSNGAAYADLDGDGDLDLVVNNLDDEAFVYENHAERLPNRHWTRVALRGPRGNPGGFGAKLVVHAGGARQYADHSPYRGYTSTVDGVVHFGLGSAARVDTLEVFWPDGAYQRLANVAADRLVTLDRRAAAPAPPPGARFTPPEPAAAPLFRPSADGPRARHVAHPVPDFKRTPLLPHSFAQGGPGLAVGDVDGNGLDDVYVGADRGEAKRLLVQTAPGRFAERVVDADPGHHDMGALLFDADGDGDQDLYVASGGTDLGAAGTFGNTLGGDAYQDRLYLNDGRGGFRRDPQALPNTSASGSSVAAADYDRDGDLDLFVGGRVTPGEYPRPARSYLLRNDTPRGGRARFTDVTDAVAPGLARVGLVCTALWSDTDGDGRVDLVLAGEWMPLTVFRNTGGGLRNATAAAGLTATRGWWNGLVAGDWDADGDTDFLAGNAGLNTRYRASPQTPLRVYAADFDGSGSVDPVLAEYRDGVSVPVAPRDLLVEQMPGMKQRFRRYADYARATMEQTLTPAERGRAYVAEATTLASSYVENVGGGRFRVRPLPRPAQEAPVFGMLARDVNGDGHLDALLVGNAYDPDTQTGRSDAGVGLVLVGDGRGGFTPAGGVRSGFFVDGDAKALAEVGVGGGRSVVVATQNGDSLRVLAPAREAPTGREVPLGPLDAHALLTLASGATRRVELGYGSTYLSQGPRRLPVPAGVRQAVVVDYLGRRRTVAR